MAAAKRLEPGSIYNYLDTDGDGVVTDEEMARAKEIAEFEHQREKFKNEDAKEDQIRKKMQERKKNILKAVIQEYLKSAEPIGSKSLMLAYNFEVSPATIVASAPETRNTEAGNLVPPTARAYESLACAKESFAGTGERRYGPNKTMLCCSGQPSQLNVWIFPMRRVCGFHHVAR